MTDTFARLRALFESCVDLPPGERTRWMEQHVADTAQRIELELMLAADAGGDDLFTRDVVARIGRLDDAAGPEFEPEHLVGRRFGAFELRRLIGRGGQGAVYLAERSGDFAQTAAVKLLRRGIHDAVEHRRFRREREILARFEHAGVARLIDGGVSGDGVPYLVMEFVEGLPIDRWCDEQRLDRDARLRLFGDLCDVVAAAQRALIVHRDIKPSNVLVTPEGRIKVLDFGIARLLDEDDAATQTAVPALTPGYGAPEQVSGGAITLATDVYALGVLLRVLLTGVGPPTGPGETPAAFPREVPAELRWIVGKACAAEPERRYRDAAELGEDVARFLAARTVSAHPPSRWYSMQKFVHRHRGSVLGSLVIVLGVLASAGVALWQAQVAREQAQRAQAVRDFVLGIFEAAKEDLPRDARPTPDVLVRAAAKKLDGDTTLSPTLRADFLGTLSRISYSSNDYAQAVAQAEQGLAALDAAGAGRARQALDLQVRRANGLVSLGKPEEADKILSARVDALRAASDETAVEGLVAYGSARIVVGHVDEAIALVREAAELAPAVYGRDDKQTLIVAATYGDILTYAGHDSEAATALKSVLGRWRDSGVPQDHYYANSLQNLATATYHLGDRVEAERVTREALALLRRIYTAPHEKIADTLFSLATPLMDAGRYDEAEGVLLEAASMYSALFGPNHPQNAGMLDGLGSLEMHRGRNAQAAEYLERATKICTDAKLEDNPDCARFWQNLSAAYLRLDRIDDAAAANRHSLDLRRHLFGEQHPAYARSLAGRAGVELARGDAAAALASADQASAIFSAKGLGDSLGAATMRRTRAAALRDLHRPTEALAALDEADATAQKVAPDDAEYRALALALRAELLADTGRTDEAARTARSVIALAAQRARLGETRWKRLEALAR